MKLGSHTLLIAAVSVVLVILTIYFCLETQSWKEYAKLLEEENIQLNDTLKQTQSELEAEKETTISLTAEVADTTNLLNETNKSLNQCYSNLADETELYEECVVQKDQLTEFISETVVELDNLTAELDDFQNQIADSMAWFTFNSNIEKLSFRMKYLADSCTSGDEINAACIPFIMGKEEGWGFKSEASDRLLSLDEMVDNKGGDCEDWSLYFKGAFNYIKEEARNEKTLVSVVSSYGNNFSIYRDWYYIDAAGKNVGTTEDNMYIICYDSHCIVAITDEEIKNSSDVYKLRGAPAIEPQDGKYMFTIGNIGAPDVCEPGNCNYAVDIWIVITDNDIYDFHYNEEWTGYQDYYEAAGHYKNQIETIADLLEEAAE